MKIKKVKWNNHPILGNLELDFADQNGVPYRNVLLAGENGTGKTSILKSLNSFLNGQPLDDIEYLEYVISGHIYKATQIVRTGAGPYAHINPSDYIVQMVDGSSEQIRADIGPGGLNSSTNPIDARFYGSVFSKARADYNTNPINSITNQLLDTKKRDADTEDNFSPLKQLLVDIDSQDNEIYTARNKELGAATLSYEDYYPTSKVYRFKNAFNGFFDKLVYEGIKSESNGKTIIFTKGGKKIPIDELSTGEKQIVFRGAYLLRNSGQLVDANIFVDEPELSMHPKWQQKILAYFTQLFSSNSVQTAQMFFATHSDHVLKEALANKNDNIVIVLKENNGTVESHKVDAPSVLPSITNAETNYLAFDIISNDYHIELYGYLQDKLTTNVKQTDIYIEAQIAFYNPTIHAKSYINTPTTYNTLPTYIRNCIHHPDATRSFTENELKISIELLIRIIQSIP